MTLKTLKLSAVAALLLSTPALAQSTSLSTGVGADADAGASSSSGVGAGANANADVTGTLTTETPQTDAGTTATAEVVTNPAVDGSADLRSMTVAELVGKNVVTARNETVGEIDYIISSGDGFSAVIGIGGFLGLGEHTVAVPMSEFVMTADAQLRLATWTEAELKALPEVDESTLESLPDDFEVRASF